jgi:protein-S-isoprenylcysteine O-methyltransferase Ste14
VNVAKAWIFVLASIEFAYVSRASLLRPTSHGFYRFFSWEGILALALLNLSVWFRDPFSWHQLISWVLLTISAFLVIDGALLLRHLGAPDERRTETPMLAFERTTTLVAAGAYRYIRHPLYSSLLFLAWGIFFKRPSWPGGLLAFVVTLLLVVAARVEEGENLRFFGQPYREYMDGTRMFIPFLL